VSEKENEGSRSNERSEEEMIIKPVWSVIDVVPALDTSKVKVGKWINAFRLYGNNRDLWESSPQHRVIRCESMTGRAICGIVEDIQGD